MLHEWTLPNGFELIVQPTSAPVASLQVWVDAGSLDERPLEAGYCHFLEHMLFKGTKRRTTSEIAGTVEGAGGEINAFTFFEYTVYHITLTNQRWELANEILADMLLGSIFKPGELEPEKEVILEEIRRSEDSPDRQLYRGAYRMIYGNGGYGRPVIGFPSTVSRCTPGRLKDFWRRWYAPGLMTLVVCGDVDPLAVEHRVKKTWGAARGRAPRERRRDVGFEQRLVAPKSRMGARPFPVNSIRWVGALPGCSLSDRVLPALDVASMVLGQGESARLHKRVFREEQLVTSVSAGLWAPAATGMFTFEVEAPVEKAGQFRKCLWDEVVRFCDEGPTPEEMERSVLQVESERIYASQSMDALANRLGFLKTALGNVRFDLEYMARVRELTREDVREAARQFLADDSPREFALLPKSFETGRLWNGADLYEQVKARARPTVRKAVLDREQVSLANGIELLLYPRQDVPVVCVQASAFGGLRAETRSKAGVGDILSEVWEKGPEGWGATRFAEFLERRSARIDSFSGRNSLGLTATMLTSHLDAILPVFAETLLRPALVEDETRRARTLALEDIRTLEDDLARLAGRLFCESLFEGHPYAYPTVGYADSVEGLTASDVQAHYRALVGEAPLVISVSGKFSVSRVVSIFEGLKRGATVRKVAEAQSFTAPRSARHVEIKKNREQSHVIVGYLGTRVTDAARYDLKVLLTVLGGQSGRLFTELRDKQGLCYTVAPVSFEGIEPGYVGVYIGCDPMKRNQAIEGIRRELERIVSRPVTAAELDRAKEFVLGRHHMEMQLNASIAGSTALNTLYGLGFDEHLLWGERLRKVTPKSVQKLAQRVFGSPAVTAVVI